MLRRRFFSIVCLLLPSSLLVGFSNASAEAYRWQIGRGDRGAATASILSTNTLSTGSRVIDYHPVLTIRCTPGQPAGWSQSVTIRDATLGSGTVEVSVRLDRGGARSEAWTPSGNSRTLSLDGKEGVARLLDARWLKLNWSLGLFSGRGEAVFNLTGIRETVSRLASQCGIGLP
jgi:hypothetical protein